VDGWVGIQLNYSGFLYLKILSIVKTMQTEKREILYLFPRSLWWLGQERKSNSMSHLHHINTKFPEVVCG